MTVTADLLAIASQATYNDFPSVPVDLERAGFELYRPGGEGAEPLYYVDSDTGFGAQVWHNPTANEYIVALRGTDFTSPKDWYTNVQLGKPQFESIVAQDLKNAIGKFANPSTIHFTGHSLGGALAQYFASEFASNIDQVDIGLTTFNSLGGMALFEQDPGINVTTALSDITATHYVIPTDAVSRLGNGHLGGNVREINLTANDLSPIEAHAMSLFIDLPTVIFETALLVNVNYLAIETAQAIASAMAVSTDSHLLSDDGQFSNVEASARLVAGLIPALLEAPDAELTSIVDAFFPNNFILQAAVASVIELRPALELIPGFEKGSVGVQAIATALFFTTQKLNDLGVSNADIDAFTVEAASLASSLNELALTLLPADNITNEIVEQGANFYQFIFGEDNNDQLVVGKFDASDVVEGDSGNDTLYGLTGDDVLRGNGGRDVLYGNAGADHLYGGEDNDFLSGGADAESDTYYYETGDGHDTIIDADLGGDRIMVNGSDLSTLTFVQLAEGSNTYRVEDQDISLLKGTLDSTIFIGSGDDQGSITLNAYTEGAFGINLQDAEAVEEPAFPADARDLEGLGGRVLGQNTYNFNYFDRLSEENAKPLIYNGDDYYSTLNYNTVFLDFSGTFFNDRLIGANDVVGDFILGLDGDDYIDGGAGTDFIEGNAGSDTIFGGEDNDTIYGDTMLPPRELLDSVNVAHELNEEQDDAENYIDGEEGDDYLVGGKYVDIIAGSEGKDTLAGNAGSDILSGGDEDDIIFGDSNLTWEFGEELPGSSFEIIRDIEYINSTESGLEYGDFIDGGDGNDVIFGEVGDDIIHGGKGEDVLFGDRSLDDPDGELPEALNGKDVIYGGEGNDQITGGGNDDLLHGGAGNDLIFGDGDTIPEQSQGDDVLYGGAGDDELLGGAGDDRLSGDAGVDKLFGEKGKDTLYGGSGNDELSGGEQEDQLWGGVGNDLLAGDDGKDNLFGGAGNDELQGGDHDDLLVGGTGSDVLFGQDGDDELSGGAGDDVLQGGDGDDTLNGGGSYDYMEGGAGRDTYVFAVGDGGAGIEDTSGAITLHFDGVASLSKLRMVQNETHTTLYYSDDQSDWVSMTNATYNYVTHIELGAKSFNKGQLSGVSSIVQTGQPSTGIEISLPDLSPEDVRVFGRNNSLVINIRQFNTGAGETGAGTLVGVADWWSENAGNYGDIHFTDAYGNAVTPDDAENLHLDNWYILDPNDRVNSLQMPLGVGLGLNESDIVRTFSSQSGQPVLIHYGSAADDRMIGGDGFQSMVGQDGNDVILGMSGDDQLHGGNGHDQLEGGAGSDELYGDAHNDTLIGGGGRDFLYGGAGNDVLYGGADDGAMHGGEGDDVYVVDPLFDGITFISDIAGHDQILFDGIKFEELYFSRSSDDLNVWVGDNRLVIDNVFDSNATWKVEEWAFSTGESYGWGDLVQAMTLNVAPVVNEPIPDFNLDIDAVLGYSLAPGQFIDPDGLAPLRYGYKVSQPDFISNLPPPAPDPEEDDEEGAGEAAAFGFGFDSDVAEWLRVDASTGAISGTPELIVEDGRILSSDIGEYRIQYNASDRLDGDGLSEFTLSVSDEAPEIDPRVGFEDMQIEAGDAFSFSLPYYDNIFFGNSQARVSVSLNQYIPEALRNIASIEDIIAGDDFHVASVFAFDDIVAGDPAELPDWLSYDPATQTFYGTPAIAGAAAGFAIHIWLTNGGETFAFEHTIDVSVVDGPAQFSLGDDVFLGIAGQTLDISFDALLANDMQWDGADLSVLDVVSNGNGTLEVDHVGELIRYTPTAAENNALLSYQAGDEGGVETAVIELEFGVGETLTAADDYFFGSRVDQLVLGGNGNDRINGRGGDDIIGGGMGSDRLRGGAGDDTLRGGLGADRILGGGGNDLLYGNAGDDLLWGGEGSDTYYFDLGDGFETLNNNSTNHLQDIDVLQLMSRLDPDDIWFSRRRNHLFVDVIGSDDSIKLRNWYLDDAFKLDAIMTSGASLDLASLDQLVQAMAGFSPPSGLGVVLPEQTRAAVMPTIASAWVPSAN